MKILETLGSWGVLSGGFLSGVVGSAFVLLADAGAGGKDTAFTFVNYGGLGIFALTMYQMLQKQQTENRDQRDKFQAQLSSLSTQFLADLAAERQIRETHHRELIGLFSKASRESTP